MALPEVGASQQGHAAVCRRSPVGLNQWRLPWLTLAFAAQDGALTLAALFLQPQVEGFPGGELRHRHHEVAPGVAHQTFDIPFVIALARTAIASPDQVVRQEPAEQRGALSGAIRQDFRHQAPVVVAEHRLGNRAEEREGMDMAIHPGLGHCCGMSPDITGIAVREVQHEEVRLLFNTTDPDQSIAEVGLSVARRMRQRHEHLLTASVPLSHVILDDRVAAGEAAFLATPVNTRFAVCRCLGGMVRSASSHPPITGMKGSGFGRRTSAVRR